MDNTAHPWPLLICLYLALHCIKTLCTNNTPLPCPIQELYKHLHKYKQCQVVQELCATVYYAPLVIIHMESPSLSCA
eukprot:1401551-Ditylum_brightwellii.AAC.1